MDRKYAQTGLVIIGVHTPEYDFERDRGRIQRFAAKFKVTHPVYIDNDHQYWDALDNDNWPFWYLVDRAGNIRAVTFGEMHENGKRANGFENVLQQLLAESEAHAAEVTAGKTKE